MSLKIRLLVALGIAANCGLLAPQIAAQPARPVVRVQFEMTGDLFRDVATTDRDSIAARVIDTVGARAAHRWGYLDWTSTSGDVPPAAEWIVKLEAEPITITLEGGDRFEDSIVRLKHYGELDGVVYEFPQSERDEIVYDVGAPKLLDQLPDKVLGKIDEHIDGLLQDWEVQTFLKKIPVGRVFIADVDRSRVVVPLRLREDLRAEPDSILSVEFTAADEPRGRLKLREDTRVPEPGELQGCIVGLILEYVVRPQIINDPTFWVPELPGVLEDVDGIKVFMIDYSPSLSGTSATEDGIVLDPGA